MIINSFVSHFEKMGFEPLNSYSGPLCDVVAERINISRVAALLAANPRTLARRIDAAIDPGLRDPGRHSGADALGV